VSNGLSFDAAMVSAKESFSFDIESGFDIIHLDPSIDIHDKNLP
jgi:tagatose-1,6-bisphosphate aldolase non-catalytic subunit AgaZ/GatZ